MIVEVDWQKKLSRFFIIPQRVILAIMGCLGITNAFAMRVCLSVAITQMVKKTVSNSSSIEAGDTCPVIDEENSFSSPSQINSGTFEWSEELQGIILSSFYYGYVLTQIVGGYLADKFGGKYTLSVGILITAILTLLTPAGVEWGGPNCLIIIRVLEGLAEGTTFPAAMSLLAQWIPPKERSKLGSVVFSGSQIGTILGTYLSSVLLHNFQSWHSVFYFFGGIGILWFILFTLLCYSNPSSHPFISEEEKAFLKEELGQLKRDKSLPPVPWNEILLSVPVLAMNVALMGHCFGFFIMVTDLPKYMSDVLRFSIKDLGFYASAPFLIMWIVCIGTGFLSDWLITTERMSITQARKWFTAVAAIGPGIFIVAASYAGCDRGLVVVLFIFVMGTMGTFYSGVQVNALDLSTNYAGILMSVGNTLNAIIGMVAPYVVGLMTPERTLGQWRMVFWVTFVVFVLSTVVYSLWGSAEQQSWNEPRLIERTDNNRGHDNAAVELDMEGRRNFDGEKEAK